ncbi:hypothetical protein [Craterilacuibacter sp.]|uniref:hypothetical protein n=1 Tax=Craterilacuibacter sp. TaxID=2870909 RepID=UPI003F3568CB
MQYPVKYLLDALPDLSRSEALLKELCTQSPETLSRLGQELMQTLSKVKAELDTLRHNSPLL